MIKKGSPKTLKGAIKNGILEGLLLLQQPMNKKSVDQMASELADFIKPHVEDYFRQKANVFVLEAHRVSSVCLYEIRKPLKSFFSKFGAKIYEEK